MVAPPITGLLVGGSPRIAIGGSLIARRRRAA